MAIQINDNFYIRAGKPIDYKYGPYISIAEANQLIPIEERYNGLIFAIYEDNLNIETSDILLFYYNGSLTDNDIVEIDKRPYIHPLYEPVNLVLSGSTVLSSFSSDEIGSVTGFTTRQLNINDLGIFDPVTGVGTLNTISKFTSNGSTIGNSILFDNGVNIGIDINTPESKLDINGDLKIRTVNNNIGDVLTINLNNVVNKRTYSELLSDINGQEFIIGGTTTQYYRGDKTFQELTTDVVLESNNRYFTELRARQSITLTTNGIGGSSQYNNVTGILNIPTYQTVLINPVTGTGNFNYISKFTSNGSTIGNSILIDNGVNLGIGINPNVDYKVFISDASISKLLTLYTSGLNIGESNKIVLGRNSSNNNNAEFSFHYNGNTSQLNQLRLGLNTNNSLLTIQGDNKVGVNTINPTDTLDINGTLRVRTLNNVLGDLVTISSNNVLQYITTNELKIAINSVDANLPIVGATKTKITFDSKGLVLSGDDLIESDIPTLSISKINTLQTNLDSKVNKSGSIMTGDLLITAPAAIDSILSGGNDVLNIGTSNADTINIGWNGSVVNIQGTLIYQNVDNLEVKDKLIRLNKGGSAGSGISSGFEIEENNIPTGYFATDLTRTGWDFKSPASQQFTLGLDLLTIPRIQKIQDTNGIIALVGEGNIDDRYVPYSGATRDVNLGLNGLSNNTIDINSDGYIFTNTVTLDNIINTLSANIIYELDKANFNGAYFDYYVFNNLNRAKRTGIIISTWDSINNTSNFTDISSNDINSTTDILSFNVDINNSKVRLLANITGGNWKIKITARTI